MSWATCYSGSNNIHFNFPPIMNDGRLFSSWQPDALVNENIQKQENIHSNWQYRQYMTNNALQIMKYNNKEACYDLGLNTHFHSNSDPATAVTNATPYLFKSTFDTSQPGFGYNNSDLKNPYLSREQLQSRKISPSWR
jgi:hypothetical protein